MMFQNGIVLILRVVVAGRFSAVFLAMICLAVQHVFGAQTNRLTAADHDIGGLTFDFATMSRERFGATFSGRRNILANPWRGNFSGKARGCVFALPHTNGGVYRVSCRTRVHLGDNPRAGGALQFRFGWADPNFRLPSNSKYVWCAFVPRDDDWYPMIQVFEVPVGMSHALLRLHTDFCSVDLEDLVVSEETESGTEDLGLSVLFTDVLDGCFAVSENQVGALAFFAAGKKGLNLDPRALRFRVTLPSGVEFLDATCRGESQTEVKTQADGACSYTFHVKDNYPINNGGWFRAAYAIVAAEKGVGDAGEGRIEALYDDGRRKFSSASRPIRFVIVPEIHVSAPKDYRNGAFVMESFEGRDEYACRRYAQFLSAVGCRWIIPTARNAGYKALPVWREQGFRVTPYALEWCKNAYKLWRDPVPESDQFVVHGDRSKMRVPAASQTMCPVAVAERTQYYRTNIERQLKENVSGTDGLWANWEPYMYQGHGCVCLRCCRAFAKYINVDVDAVATGWPTNAFPGGVWEKEGRRFRSFCHGNLVKTLSRSVEDVIRDSSDQVGFVPGVFYEQMNSTWRVREPMAEAQEIDYAGALRWICTWGPYLHWNSTMPYLVERGKYVGHCIAGRNVRAQVNSDYQVPNRPKLLAAPQGTCGAWLTQPENFEMALDAYFFNRYDACAPWTFPVGADARYWRAFSSATARAAKYEDFVRDGVLVDSSTFVKTVPEYACPVSLVTKRMPDETNVVQLQTFAFELKGTRIVAALNCWQLGEAFFSLRIVGIPAGDYEVVSEDGILWSPSENDLTWTSDELGRGIFLSVGAARTRVFEIRLAGCARLTIVKSVMTRERISGFYKKRRETLAAAAQRDKEVSRIDFRGVSRDD